MLPQTRMMINHYGIHDKKNRRTTRDSIFKLSLALNVILTMSFALLYISPQDIQLKGLEMTWHGGHPMRERAGSCWCGKEDKYCMCTPNVAIDLIILQGNHVWLVRRKDTSQLATMGGFIDTDETAEHAVKRELMEEMAIEIKEPPILFGVYSDPRRDNRRRNISVVYAVQLREDVHPKAGDDAKEVIRLSLDDIEKHDFFSDHKTILLDYRRHARKQAPLVSSDGDFAADIVRSTCSAIGSQ